MIEIIGILLPLTGIFVQLTTRVVDDLLEDEPENIAILHSTLLSAALALGIAGTVATGVQSILLAGFWPSTVTGLLYVAFLLVTAAIAILWAWVHPGIPLPAGQQTLQETTENGGDEE